MTTYSRADLRDQVMEEIQVKEGEETPNADDAALVSRRCQQKLERLAEDGLIPFDLDSDAIPAPYMIPLAQVIAPTCLGAFGMNARRGEFEALAEIGMKELWRLRQQPHYGATVAGIYF